MLFTGEYINVLYEETSRTQDLMCIKKEESNQKCWD